MNIAVLYAYPNDNGYNHAILNSVMQGLEDNPARHSVTVVDLYRENFDPVLRFDENHLRRNLNINPDTERCRRIITDADLLVFIYPIWWSGIPAILKGFIDRVFSKGFAYVYRGVLPKGLLKGKKAWIVTTNDTPGFYARLFEPDYGKVSSITRFSKSCAASRPSNTTRCPTYVDQPHASAHDSSPRYETTQANCSQTGHAGIEGLASQGDDSVASPARSS